MIRKGLLIGGVCLLAIGGALGTYIARPPEMGRLTSLSSSLLDQDGALLELRLTPSGHWREEADLDEIDPKLISLLIAYEDKRFYDHPGVDILALFRAVGDVIMKGRITSGASTLTMQTARLMYPELGRKSLLTKLHQMLYALRLDAHWRKEDILKAYFTLAPYGGNIEGVKAASHAWFQKSPAELTMSEAALLVALPQSPEGRRPDRYPERAHEAKARVLQSVAESEAITPEDLFEYQQEYLPSSLYRPRSLAPHLMDRLSKDGLSLKSSIRQEWQGLVAALVASAAQLQPRPINAAAMVTERRSGLVRAYVGSAGYNSLYRKGANNYLTALRSPGSTLKPLIYAKAIEQRLLKPDAVFRDHIFQKGGYTPTNFDQTYSGDITLREALVRSLNIPAITTLEKIGPVQFENRIRHFLKNEDFNQSSAGLSLAVGGLYMQPEDLMNLYLAFTDPDQAPMLRFSEANPKTEAPYLTSPAASEDVLSLLTQLDASGRKVLFKTGTSHNRQDAWTVMITKDHIILVWFGTPDNTETRTLTGRDTAYPLALQISESLGLEPPEFTAPLPTTAAEAETQAQNCPKLIQFPEDGEWIRSSDLRLRVEGARGANWFLNGEQATLVQGHLDLPSPGSHILSARLENCFEAHEIFLEVREGSAPSRDQ